MPAELQGILFSVIGIIITGLATWGTSVLIALINEKIKDKKVARFLADITQIVFDSVQCVYQEFVEVLKKNGTFDEVAKVEAKNRARQIIKTSLCDELKDYITDHYGDIDAWLDTKIESVLYSLKQ